MIDTQFAHLKLIIGVVNVHQASRFLDYTDPNLHLGSLIIPGHTVIHDMLMNWFGFEDQRKELALLIAESSYEEAIYENIKKQWKKRLNGTITTISLDIDYGMTPTTLYNCRQEGGTDMGYEIIVTIVDHGKADTVIDASKEISSVGATVIHARGRANPNDPKLFGINIEPEKDMVLILAPKDQTLAIMEKIRESLDIESPNKGIIFTLDASRVMGLNDYNTSK